MARGWKERARQTKKRVKEQEKIYREDEERGAKACRITFS